jgi:hypothetical protein
VQVVAVGQQVMIEYFVSWLELKGRVFVFAGVEAVVAVGRQLMVHLGSWLAGEGHDAVFAVGRQLMVHLGSWLAGEGHDAVFAVGRQLMLHLGSWLAGEGHDAVFAAVLVVVVSARFCCY